MGTYKVIPDSELTYGIDCPYIDIQWKGRFFASNAVFRLIGKSGGIRLLWNSKKRTLVIAPTTIDDPDGIPLVGVNYTMHESLIMGCATLIHEIWSVLDWDKTLRFRIVAKYNETSNVAIFEMDNAIGSEIPRNIRGGRPRKPNSKRKRKPSGERKAE